MAQKNPGINQCESGSPLQDFKALYKYCIIIIIVIIVVVVIIIIIVIIVIIIIIFLTLGKNNPEGVLLLLFFIFLTLVKNEGRKKLSKEAYNGKAKAQVGRATQTYQQLLYQDNLGKPAPEKLNRSGL